MPRCVLVIPDLDGRRILVARDGPAWRLPSVMVPSGWVAAEVGAIQTDTRRELGVDAVVLRELAADGDDVAAELELLAVPRTEPDGHAFVDAADLLEHTDVAAHREIVERWRSANDDDRPPWARRGWLATVTAWIDARMSEAGIARTGPVRQIKGAWADSAVLAASTDAGEVYFKASAEHSVEPLALGELHERRPGDVAGVLAIDPHRRWMLMRDAGGVPLTAPRHADALRRFAELQIAEAAHVDAWLALGVPDRRLTKVRAKLERVLVEIPRQLERGGLLAAGEASAFAALVPEAASLCDRLAALGIPESLTHDDFQPVNVLDAGGRLVFLDWSDVAVAHPFFSAHYFIERAGGAGEDAYLEPWGAVAGEIAALEAFEVSRRLYPVYRAVLNDAIEDYEEWLRGDPPIGEREFARGVFAAIRDALSRSRVK